MIYDMRRGHIAGNIDLRNQTLMGYFKAPPQVFVNGPLVQTV